MDQEKVNTQETAEAQQTEQQAEQAAPELLRKKSCNKVWTRQKHALPTCRTSTCACPLNLTTIGNVP